MEDSRWEVCIIDDREWMGEWEISVKRPSHAGGKKEYGNFGEDKLLVSADCDGAVVSPYVWEATVRLAEELCRKLNTGESIELPETKAPPEDDKWEVWVIGDRLSGDWEISVVKSSNLVGKTENWGFGETKILVNASDPDRSVVMPPYVWEATLALAEEMCRKLNAGEIDIPKQEEEV